MLMVKTMVIIQDPVKSQKNVAQSGDEDINVDLLIVNIFFCEECDGGHHEGSGEVPECIRPRWWSSAPPQGQSWHLH